MIDETAVSAIDELFAPFSSGPNPGANVAIVRHGEVELVRSYGMSSIEHDVPNSRDTVFYIASTSKQFVAASIAMLEAEGKVSLDDNIRTWLPEMHPFDPPILVHHLLHHTSGIRDKYALAAVGALPEESYATDRGSLELLRGQTTLGFGSGTRMVYSNSGYFLLGQIVERASGSPLHEFAAQRIFGPLEMANTCFRPDTNVVIPHRASGYSKGPAKGPANDPANDPDGEWRLAEYTLSSLGPGGVVTTVDDLARWDASFGRPLLHPPDLHARMLRTRPLTDGSPNTYAFGLMVDKWRGLDTVSHGGGVAGFTAEFLRFPAVGLTIICLANSPFVAAGAKARQIAEIVLGEQLEPATPIRSDGPACSGTVEDGACAGTYVAEDDTLLASICASDDEHVIDVAGQRIPLTAAGDRTLLAGPLTLDFDDSGAFVARQGSTTIGRFDRLDDAPPPTASDLSGDYRSDELCCTATVRLDDDALVIERPRVGATPLKHATGDVFTTAGPAMGSQIPLVVRVLRAQNGAISALSISTGRAPRNIFTSVT